MRWIPVLVLAACAGNAEETIVGRIVAYDWMENATTPRSHFVVLLTKQSRIGTFVRVMYPGGEIPFDSPGIEPLPRTAFIARGPTLYFRVRKPSSSSEESSCKRPFPDHTVQEDGKSVTIPRFVPTPGGAAVGYDPRALPCVFLVSPNLEPPR